MNLRSYKWLMLFGLVLSLGLGSPNLTVAHDEEEPPPAPGSTWEPETCLADNVCGEVGPLIPMTYNAVGAGIVWTKDNWEQPKIQYKGRHSEFKPTDVVSEDCVEQMVLNSGFSAWPIPRSEWAAQFPSGTAVPAAPVTQNFATWTNPATAYNIFTDSQRVTRLDPVGNSHGTKSMAPCFRSSFKHLVYGEYTYHQGQSLFVANRIRAYYGKENSQLWDLGHPDAFKTRPGGVFDNALLDEEDALLNLASFTDAGASRGLHYNIYSLGYATLADGRSVNIGGHSGQSNNGYRKLNIYEPETNSWVNRPLPCNVANWRADPGGVALGYQAFADAAAGGPGLGDRLVNPPGNPSLGTGAPTWSDCNQHIRDHVDPPHSSDMRYGRWYPSGITLPNGKVLIYGGDDLDESVLPNYALAPFNARDAAFRASQIFTPVSEVYDPKTDTTVALENARKVWPLYPFATVVSTGPKKDDWKVCVIGGAPAPASEATVPRSDAIDEAAEWRNFCATPGCAADTRAIRRLVLPTRAGSLDCLDVLAAEKDPNRNIPAENHWTHIDTAKDNHGYNSGMATLVKIGPKGETLSHKFVVMGGTLANSNTRTADIEMIDLVQPNPQFVLQQPMYQPATNIHAVMLPDGKVLLRGGAGPGGASFETANMTRHMLFNPADGTTTTLAKSTFLGALHKTVMLLPDATTIAMAGDRSAMVAVGDRVFSPGDQDTGVSNAEIFSPPYLFADAAGTPAARPVIQKGPDKVGYGETMTVEVGATDEIKLVSMIRTGFVTHSLHTDNVYVELHVKSTQQGENEKVLKVNAPKLPAQAVPGDYMLFVVNTNGTPSVAKHVRLMLDD